MGFPIRKSADQSLFATPHGLSQRTTSFIASQRQGIHRTPLRHLIALIIEDRSEGSDRFRSERPFASNISKSSCGQARPTLVARFPLGSKSLWKRLDMFPLHDDRQHARPSVRPALAVTNARDARNFQDEWFGARCDRSTIWWSQTGSNRRPHACKARALPTELWPRRSEWRVANSERRRRFVSTSLLADRHSLSKLVGLGRLELPTSRLSSARSNQLSYKPEPIAPWRFASSEQRAARPVGKKEKRRRRCPARPA